MEKFRQLRQKNAVLEVKGAHSPYTRVFWVNLATYKIIFKLREYILKMKQQQDDIDECKENSEQIRVPDGIWTLDPPWSGRMV